MFACFFQTNFPNIPFLKPKLLSLLVVYLFLQLFLFSCFMFLPFCFDVGFVFGMFYLFLSCFLFCFLFCLHRLCLHRLWKNIVFPAIPVFLAMLVSYKVVLYFFSFMFWFLFFFFLVLFVSNLDILFVLFCVCVVWFFSFQNMTKWFCCLHLVVFFPFFVVLFWILSFFIPLKQDPPKTGHGKNPKKQKCRKKTDKKNQLAQLCSQIVFLFFWGRALQMQMFAENAINIVVSAYFEK